MFLYTFHTRNPYLGFLMSLLLCFIVGAFCWPYLINHALELIGKPPKLLWWQGGLIGMVPGFGWAGVILCVIVFLAGLFLT